MKIIDVLFSQFGWWIQLLLTVAILAFGFFQFVTLYFGKKTTLKKTNIDALLVMGVFTAAIGITCQILGMVMALEAMIQAADISPQMVMMGFKISFYTTIYGLFVFLISTIFWYLNKIKWEANKMDN